MPPFDPFNSLFMSMQTWLRQRLFELGLCPSDIVSTVPLIEVWALRGFDTSVSKRKIVLYTTAIKSVPLFIIINTTFKHVMLHKQNTLRHTYGI